MSDTAVSWRTVRADDGVELALHPLGAAASGDADAAGDAAPTSASPAAGAPPAGAQPVLFAHPFGFNGGVWDPVARELPEVAAWGLDLRGHGCSVVPDDHDFDWDQFAGDAVAAARSLGTPLVGVGHSGGGTALLLGELARPGTFSALYLYEPALAPAVEEISPRAAELAQATRRRRDWYPSHDAAAATLGQRAPLSTFDRAAVRGYVERAFGPGPDGTVRLRCSPEVEARVYETGPAVTDFARLEAIGCPVTVVLGADTDPDRSARFNGEVADRIPAGRLITLPGRGHFAPQEDPPAIAASIARELLGS